MEPQDHFPCQARKVLSLLAKQRKYFPFLARKVIQASSYSFISKSGWTIYVLGWKWQMWQTACWARKTTVRFQKFEFVQDFFSKINVFLFLFNRRFVTFAIFILGHRLFIHFYLWMSRRRTESLSLPGRESTFLACQAGKVLSMFLTRFPSLGQGFWTLSWNCHFDYEYYIQ